MIRRHCCAGLLVFFIVVALPHTAAASARRRTINPSPDDITILQTTDIHDHANGSGHAGLDVDPSTAMSVTGAYARIAAYVSHVRATAGHPVVLVDSGDWTMGTLYDLTLASKPLALYFLNAMKYDAVTLGNHEFDYTPRGLAQMIGAARTSFGFQTPIVASNMTLGGNTDLAPFFGPGKAIQATYVKQLSNGLKVGFIGLMGEDAAIDAPASAPVSFSPLSFTYDKIQANVDELRNQEGAQIVIALSHSGTSASGNSGEDVELARHVKGINVIASGHTHTPLAAAHAVTNGTWTTHIIDAGAFGTNVARLELGVDRLGGVTTPHGFTNVAMTNATVTPDAATTALVSTTDHQLNGMLAPVLTQSFSDYDASNLGKGIYHPVAVAAQDMVPNDINPVLAPNGLGDFAADSVRNVANLILAQSPTATTGAAFFPYQLAVVATGVLRGTLPAGVPLTFADIYNILPLGFSPDTTQALPVGYPLMSVYADLADVKKICALQLVGQANLIGSSFYLNFSGVRYTLKPTESYTFFKYATAAAILSTASSKAGQGSTAALQALSAVVASVTDQGASLASAAAAGNPYAAAMTKLNDTTPNASQIATNVSVLAEVLGQALTSTNAVSALIVSKAVNAIDTVSGFAPTDTTNTGQTTDLTGGRVHVVVDLYALFLINAIESQYGIKVTPYQSATGTTVLSPADMTTLLGNRIDASPLTPGIQELKEWMALLSNAGSGVHGVIGPEYASTSNFTDFPKFGAAVQTRNSTYPLAAVGQLVATSAALQRAP